MVEGAWPNAAPAHRRRANAANPLGAIQMRLERRLAQLQPLTLEDVGDAIEPPGRRT